MLLLNFVTRSSPGCEVYNSFWNTDSCGFICNPLVFASAVGHPEMMVCTLGPRSNGMFYRTTRDDLTCWGLKCGSPSPACCCIALDGDVAQRTSSNSDFICSTTCPWKLVRWLTNMCAPAMSWLPLPGLSRSPPGITHTDL